MANYWKLYRKAKIFYFNLGKIKCPALNDKEIIFDWRGFRHFLHKSKGKRQIADQIRRYKLLFKMPSLIKSAIVLNYRDKSIGKRKTLFISMVCKDENIIAKIIILDDGLRKY